MNREELLASRVKQLERELLVKQYIIDCLGNEFADLKEEAAEADAELSAALVEVEMYKKKAELYNDRIAQLDAKIDSLKNQLTPKPLNP